jgi:hypothetical protein
VGVVEGLVLSVFLVEGRAENIHGDLTELVGCVSCVPLLPIWILVRGVLFVCESDKMDDRSEKNGMVV